MGFFSGLFGNDSAKDAIKDLREDVARLSEENKFRPFNVSSPLFNTNFEDGTASANLSPSANRTFTDFNRLIDRTGSTAARLNPQGLAQEFFSQLDALASPREQSAFSDFESAIFNRSGVHTGSARQIADFQSDLDAARQNRKFAAIGAAQDFTTNLFNNFLGLNQGRTALNAAALNPLQMGINFGQIQTEANQPLLDAAFGVADIDAARKAQSGVNFGSLMDDALSFGLGFI